VEVRGTGHHWPDPTSKTDVTAARRLVANENAKKCFAGQNPVNAGFFLSPEEAFALIEADPKNRDVLSPCMIGRDLIEHSAPTRWIIDLAQRGPLSAMRYELPFARVKKEVMPVVLERAEREKTAKREEVTTFQGTGAGELLAVQVPRKRPSRAVDAHAVVERPNASGTGVGVSGGACLPEDVRGYERERRFRIRAPR